MQNLCYLQFQRLPTFQNLSGTDQSKMICLNLTGKTGESHFIYILSHSVSWPKANFGLWTNENKTQC